MHYWYGKSLCYFLSFSALNLNCIPISSNNEATDAVYSLCHWYKILFFVIFLGGVCSIVRNVTYIPKSDQNLELDLIYHYRAWLVLRFVWLLPCRPLSELSKSRMSFETLSPIPVTSFALQAPRCRQNSDVSFRMMFLFDETSSANVPMNSERVD